ncbi:MAG: hypothetical protein JSR46_10610 [Verrucomicrobia bacterium]|nr:hypothetical protein [Verrucomicrobiota bacterium]
MNTQNLFDVANRCTLSADKPQLFLKKDATSGAIIVEERTFCNRCTYLASSLFQSVCTSLGFSWKSAYDLGEIEQSLSTAFNNVQVNDILALKNGEVPYAESLHNMERLLENISKKRIKGEGQQKSYKEKTTSLITDLKLAGAIQKPLVGIVAERYGVPDGIGDLLFAQKMEKIIEDRFGGDVKVLLVARSDYEATSFADLKEPVSTHSLTELPEEIQKAEKSLLIHGPVPKSPLPPELSIHAKVWDINEYSTTYTSAESQIETLHSGLGEGELGIFCDAQLYKEMKELEKRGLPFDRQKLKEISNDKLRDIVGQKSDRELFFAYAHDYNSLTSFMKQTMESHPDVKNIDFVCMGNALDEDELKAVTARFKEAGSVELCFVNEPEKNRTLTLKPESDVRVRVIFPGSVNHADFIRLLQGSNPEVLVTGDQSLTEAISSGKVIHYEVAGHKRGLDRNLSSLAAKLNNKTVQAFLSANKTGADRVEALKNPELHRGFRELADYIWINYNLEEEIVQRVAKELGLNPKQAQV